MKEFFNKNKNKIKIVSTVTVIAIAVALVVSSALAYFKFEVEEEATITTMNTDILLVQNPDTSNGLKYTIQPTNENTDYVYVRLVVFPIIEIQKEVNSSEWNAYAGIPISNLNYDVEGTDWTYYDGYYYYKYQVDSGINSVRKTTSEISIKNIQLDTTSYDNGSGEWFELPTSVDGRKTRVRFYVSAEAVQAKNNAYQLSWDLTRDEFITSIGIKDLNTIYDTSDGIKK